VPLSSKLFKVYNSMIRACLFPSTLQQESIVQEHNYILIM